MDYLREMKAFYDRLELNPQPNTAIALWHALMSIANKAGWPDTFTVASSVLGLRSGLNASALKRARNTLSMNGFIEWKSRGGNQSAQYHMISIAVQYQYKNEPQSEPQCEPQCEPQSEPQSEPIIKHKHKQETKTNNTMCESVALFEKVWSMYPCKKGKGQVSDKAKRDLLAIGEDELVRAIDRYQRDLEQDADWRKPQNGSTFFSSGYIDYLDANYVEPKRKPNKNKFNNMPQRERTDSELSALERKLLAK